MCPTCPSTAADATEEAEDIPEELNQAGLPSSRKGIMKMQMKMPSFEFPIHLSKTIQEEGKEIS